MSFAVCRMQKMKSFDLKGIQFHNQRERESKTNPDIDKEKSNENYDFVNEKNIDYNERVKEIIDSQKIGTRKIRKDAVLVNELLVTSGREFFEGLDPAEQKRFFRESFKLFSDRYGEQNIAYATVHNDEKTPHLHIGVVPMRDGKLQGKNVFNRAELIWIQDKFPEHMQKLGFNLDRGEKGSNREHIETQIFKKQTLEKEIDLLEKNIVYKKDELSAFSEKVESDLTVPVKRRMKNIEVPTGEKTLFGKEKTRIEKKPTKDVIISEQDYKKLVTAARDNEKLKIHLKHVLSTDMAKENRDLRQKNKAVKEKYSDLVQKFNVNVGDYNELVEEYNELAGKNRSLKARVADLKQEVDLIYQSTKEFLRERVNGLQAFRRAFKDLVDKVKEKAPGSEFERLHKRERRREQSHEMER